MKFSLYGTPYCANMLTFAFVWCKTHPWEDITALPSSQRFCQIQSVLLGLGLCRMSAAGNKTIAMNCLRIMLGINPPRAHIQTSPSNENPFLMKLFISCRSRSLEFLLRRQRLSQNMFLICGSFPGLFLHLGGGSCVSVVEWCVRVTCGELLAITPQPRHSHTASDRPTILRPTTLNTKTWRSADF